MKVTYKKKRDMSKQNSGKPEHVIFYSEWAGYAYNGQTLVRKEDNVKSKQAVEKVEKQRNRHSEHSEESRFS